MSRAGRILISLLLLAPMAASAQGLAGEPAAVARAGEMIERVGGRHVWSRLASLQLTQRFYLYRRPESVVHVEWIDFREPRLHVTIDSELTRRGRAYDARGGWFLRDGVVQPMTAEQLANELASGERLCWFRLNQDSEPVLWGASADRQSLEFLFGPLAPFGNIRVPRWGGFTDGSWRFDMLDARGSALPPPVSYDPPAPGAPTP